MKKKPIPPRLFPHVAAVANVPGCRCDGSSCSCERRDVLRADGTNITINVSGDGASADDGSGDLEGLSEDELMAEAEKDVDSDDPDIRQSARKLRALLGTRPGKADRAKRPKPEEDEANMSHRSRLQAEADKVREARFATRENRSTVPRVDAADVAAAHAQLLAAKAAHAAAMRDAWKAPAAEDVPWRGDSVSVPKARPRPGPAPKPGPVKLARHEPPHPGWASKEFIAPGDYTDWAVEEYIAKVKAGLESADPEVRAAAEALAASLPAYRAERKAISQANKMAAQQTTLARASNLEAAHERAQAARQDSSKDPKRGTPQGRADAQGDPVAAARAAWAAATRDAWKTPNAPEK